MNYDIIVIGGGAAGMMAAGVAGSRGKRVLLIEKNEKLGKKLYITGKGRCNITNIASLDEFLNNIPTNAKFLYSAFDNFFNEDLIELLNSLKVETKIERGGRVFPKSDKSSDIIRAFQSYLAQNHVSIRLNSKVKNIFCEENSILGIGLEDKSLAYAPSVIIATGGLSYPVTGSNGDGYDFAKELGHDITDLIPSLVPLVVRENYIDELEGLTLKNVTLTAYSGEKVIYKGFGELLFTSYGLSGPLVLTSSYFISKSLRKNKKVFVSIDLKPYMENKELDKRILKDFSLNPNRQFKNSLNNLLPKKIIPVVIRLSKIPQDKPVNLITRAEREGLLYLLKHLKFEIIKTRPIEEAIITSGGVSLKNINPKTMESKLIKGLFFAGEVLDIDAFTGGFNLQIAFSTGYTAGYNS